MNLIMFSSMQMLRISLLGPGMRKRTNQFKTIQRQTQMQRRQRTNLP